jgi:hypothetical protein
MKLFKRLNDLSERVVAQNNQISELYEKVWCLENPPKYKKGDKVKNVYVDSSVELTVLEITFDKYHYNWVCECIDSEYKKHKAFDFEITKTKKS